MIFMVLLKKKHDSEIFRDDSCTKKVQEAYKNQLSSYLWQEWIFLGT